MPSNLCLPRQRLESCLAALDPIAETGCMALIIFSKKTRRRTWIVLVTTQKESNILKILLSLVHHLSYVDSIWFKDDLQFCWNPNLIQELDIVSLKNVNENWIEKEQNATLWCFGLPSHRTIDHIKGDTCSEYSENHTYKHHTAHLISWGPFGKGILASMISMRGFRTIQGWPSWERLFALGLNLRCSSRCWNEWANILRRVLHKQRIPQQRSHYMIDLFV